ncbi:MAG: ABC transporter permease [Bacteroidetes bacterium QS_8_68_15]|nr:MAG: ABC transporter permease [Bacteroidetes bacterium QS_8_68_15]
MRFERFMAWRYLRGAEGRAGEGRGFLRFITYVSIGGVAVGVAALLLALAIVRGFSSEIEEKITGFGAHVQVRSLLGEPLGQADSLRTQLASLDHVERVAPVVERFVILRHSRSQIDGVALWGTRAPPGYLEERVTSGAFSFAADSAGHPGAVVGATLAQRLGLAVGDVVTIFSMPDEAATSASGGLTAGGAAAAMQAPRVKQFRITGVFETSLADFDDLYVFTGLDAARELTGAAAGEVTRLDLTLDRVTRADSVAAQIQERFDFPVGAATVYQVFSGLFAWVNLQESITPLVIGVIILVAAFNIISTLLMLMVEKTREMGVLRSLGASGTGIQRLFVGLGLLIGMVGTALGALLALALGLLQKRYELIPLPAEAYYMTTAPVELRALDFVLVSVVAVALCAAASYVPARAAARLDPVRAIQFR